MSEMLTVMSYLKCISSFPILPVNLLSFLAVGRLALGRCLLSVIFSWSRWVPRVTFAANLLGDVLCSFVRPLKDTVYTVCYLGRASGSLFRQNPTHLAEVCNYRGFAGRVCTLLILDLPFFFRLLQCLRRYVDASPRRPAHLLNALKYSVSLFVSAVAFVGDQNGSGPTALIVASTCATIYSLAWDVIIKE